MKVVPWLAAMLVVTAAGIRAQAPAEYPYEVLPSLVLPKGDVKAGRQAFQDLKCYVCHRVAGESRFPAPFAEVRGPDLDATLLRQDPSDVATAIVAPSHSMSVRTSEAVRKRVASESRSPMADFSRVLTVRQLADVLAYLLSTR